MSQQGKDVYSAFEVWTHPLDSLHAAPLDSKWTEGAATIINKNKIKYGVFSLYLDKHGVGF